MCGAIETTVLNVSWIMFTCCQQALVQSACAAGLALVRLPPLKLWVFSMITMATILITMALQPPMGSGVLATTLLALLGIPLAVVSSLPSGLVSQIAQRTPALSSSYFLLLNVTTSMAQLCNALYIGAIMHSLSLVLCLAAAKCLVCAWAAQQWPPSRWTLVAKKKDK